jgi:hypothetical protein
MILTVEINRKKKVKKEGRKNPVAYFYKFHIFTFEISAKFRYLETTVTNQDLIHDEIKNRLSSG